MLYHLAQLTSVVSPKSTSFSVKVKKQNEFKKSMDDISFSNFSEVSYYGNVLYKMVMMIY